MKTDSGSISTKHTGVTVQTTMIILILVCLLSFSGSAQAQDDAISASRAPYLIIHLDAIPSKLFFEEYDADRLPNIKAAFEGGKVVRHAVSPFFAGTEMLYPRLKNGQSVEQPLPVTWEMYDRKSGEYISYMETVVKLFSNLPRYALTQVIHGIPGMEWMAGCALLNTTRMLEEYDIVEFFWFATDAHGHVFGEEAQKESLLILDQFFGLLTEQLESDRVNLVLYADHGMSMFEQMYDVEAAMSEVAGDNVKYQYYPNLHLKDRTLVPATAERLSRRDEIDYAFYRVDESLIAGVHKEGLVMFSVDGDRIAYSCQGHDPFGYNEMGYDGRPLSDQQWLECTCATSYPAVPVQIVRYMQNSLSGDIVVVLNPPKGLKTLVGLSGCHTGFADTDCTVGVLMNGPDIDPSQIPDTFWLHEMYSKILKIDPRSPVEAGRERNSLMMAGSGIELRLSPLHGLSTITSIGPEGWTSIGEASIARSFITQIWAGLGMTVEAACCEAPTPIASARLEVYLGPVTYDWHNIVMLPSGERIATSALRVETKRGATLEWKYPKCIKVGISW